MKWHQDLDQELLVFRFQREGKPIDDTAKDLKKFSYSIELFCLINKPVLILRACDVTCVWSACCVDSVSSMWIFLPQQN